MSKIRIKEAGFIFLGMMIVTIIVHLLVIMKVVPFEWVNGGRSLSYNSAMTTSISSIVILLVISAITLVSSTIIKVNLPKASKMIIKVSSWILVGYFAFTCILQFLGTNFELFFMSIVCIISFLSLLRIALEKR